MRGMKKASGEIAVSSHRGLHMPTERFAKQVNFSQP